MKRSEAREFVMQTIFQIEAQKDWSEGAAELYLKEKNLLDTEISGQQAYVKKLLGSICSNLEHIDETINAASSNWNTKRMAKSDLAIIRTATAELMYLNDVPKAVAINEAVELAKKYGSEQSPKFVNAVLGHVEI